MANLREKTRHLLDGDTLEEGRGRRIKGVVEVYFAFQSQIVWLVITYLVLYILKPEGEILFQIGPISLPAVNFSILGMFILLALYWVRSEYKAIHCEYPGDPKPVDRLIGINDQR